MCALTTYAVPKRALWAEFLLVFALPPVILAWVGKRPVTIAVLLVGTALAYAVLRRWPAPPDEPVILTRADFHHALRAIVLRFILLSLPLVALTLYLVPEYFLFLPKKRPDIWIRVMLLYPILSVWPQEFLFRRFILVRYYPLFQAAPLYVAASSLVFGFAHIILLNPVAVILSALGGVMFANGYRQHRSLFLACFEHALYGCLIFTIGLGRFFYNGTVVIQ